MSMQQAQEPTRKRPAWMAQTSADAAKRLKSEIVQGRPSLTQMLSRKSALEPQLPLSQTSEDSDVPLARLAAQQKAKRLATAAAETVNGQQKARASSQGKADEQGDVVFELSTKRRVTVRKWKSMKFVDIRDFYDDNGESKPGKKGISLSPDQWEKLCSSSDAIAEAILLVEEDDVGMDSLAGVPGCILRPDGDVRAIALPLSNKRRATIRYFRGAVLIDVREFYELNGVSKPSKKGISLSKDQWISLQQVAEDITEAADRL